LAAVLLCAAHAPAQEPAADEDGYDGSRQIKYNGFSKARQPASNKKPTPPPAPVYERVDAGRWNAPQPKPAATPQTATKPTRPPAPPRRRDPVVKRTLPAEVPTVAAQSDTVDIGVTVWRLRPGKLAGEEAGVSFLTADSLAQLVTPVRITGTDPVQLGDRLRFSIESPRAGYLYVINRTQYTDGSVGEPELIFPTTRTRGGDNRVKPGRLVYIPALDDDVPYYKVTADGPAGKVNVGEIIHIVYSPKPIPELATLNRDKVRISREMVEKWTSTWGDLARQQQLNLVGGEDRAATRAEHEAGEAGGRSLRQDEPTPQTLFRVHANPNGPAMVTLHLLYGDSATSKK
jgi:hypothetical protein